MSEENTSAKETFLVSKRNKGSFTTTNKVQLIKGGRDYFDLLLKLIGEAKESIHLQVYIYDDDETGKQVGAALSAAVLRGVQVYLLTDGYASQVMSQKFIDELKEAGIHFRYFEPVFRSRHFYFGRRMHHKVFVCDAKYSLVGGINISDRYNDKPGKPAWLDYALYAEGEISQELCVLCWKAWYGFSSQMGITPCEEKKPSFNDNNGASIPVRMRRNDWVRHKNEISATYIEMLRTARSHMIIMCSYFLPGRVFRRLLANAARRGVKIKIITAGFSDVRITKPAERWLYDWMLRNKVTLHEYQPNVLHAKVAVCDGDWMTIGSYNVNNLSAYASIELNLDVKDAAFTHSAEAVLAGIIEKDCIEITAERHRKSRNIFRQLARWFSYELIRLIFFLTTFYYRQEKVR